MKTTFLNNYVEKYGGGELCMAYVSNCLFDAYKDGVKYLLVSQEEHDLLLKYMLHNGNWNWDMKTCFGMEFIVTKKNG